MNAPFDTDALHAVLDRATEHIESPHLTVAALAGARRVRARRRVAAAGAAALAVVAAFGISQVVGDPKSAPPVAPPMPAPNEIPIDLVAPEISADVVQPGWDPATAASLPEEDLSSYANRTMLIDDGDDLEVMLTGGGDPVTIEYPEAGYGPEGEGASAISGSGMVLAYIGKTGLWWRDFRDEDQAEWHRVDYPSDFSRALDSTHWAGVTFGTDDTLYLRTTGLTWIVDLASGGSERLPLDAVSFDPATTPEGSVVAAAYHRTSDTQTIQELDGAELVRAADSAPLGWVESLAVNADLIAAVHGTGDDRRARRDGLVALDRHTLEATAFLPFTNPEQMYDWGGYHIAGWLDGSTVLLEVSTYDGAREPRTHLVTWNVDTGHLARVGEVGRFDVIRLSAAP